MSRDGEFKPGFRITEHQADANRDAADEISFHLAMRERELMAQGMSAEEARAAALVAFGDVDNVRAALVRLNEREQRSRLVLRFADSLRQDVHFALRTLWRSPVFAAVAILTLALGIGANAVIFSLIEAALLRAPAVSEPDRLVAVWTTSRRGDLRSASSYPDYEDYRDRSTRLADLAAYAPFSLTLATEAGAELIAAELVTGNYFSTLGLRAEAGRLLLESDDAAGGDHAVAVLSHAYWRSRYGGDRAAIGRTIRLNGISYEVVGVASREFDGLVLGQVPDVWAPLRGLAGLFPSFGPQYFEGRAMRWIGGLVGRLEPNATPEQARTDLGRISDQLFAEDSAARGPRRITVDPLPRRILPGGARVDSFLALLQGAVALTLLLACANLANLLMARATARRGEVAVRRALGVSPGRLVRQLLTESVLLSVFGGLLGLGLAQLTLRSVASFELPFGMVLGSVGATLNLEVTAFALGAALLTGVLSGVLPAMASRGGDVAVVLRETRGGDTRASVRVRSALIGFQLALAVVLLVGAVLFVRTLRNRLRFDLGFPVQGLAMITVDPSMNRYTAERANALIGELVARASSLPGVRSASASVMVPVEGGGMGTFVTIDGYEPSPDEELRAEFNVVAPGFLRTLGLPLISGREIQDADIAAGARVIVIDETMATRWWRDRDPLGGVVRFRTPAGAEPFTVIGVMKRSAWGGIEVGTDPFMLVPSSRMPGRGAGFEGTTAVIARTQGDARALVASLRELLRAVDPGVAVLRARTMSQELNARLAGQRAAAWLISTFSALALVLAVLGIYGVVSYVAAQRRRELSVRMALGARATQIVFVVSAGLLVPCAIGLAGGIAGARALSRFAESFLFGVTASDPATYFLVALVLAVTAVMAAVLPAVRARVDPAQVMRQE